MRTALFSALMLGALLCGSSFAQNVANLRNSSYDLPQTTSDTQALNAYFGALGAVQVECSKETLASLEEEDAAAACATMDVGLKRENTLRLEVEVQFRVANIDAEWLTPWQANPDFGIVRQIAIGENVYFLTLDVEGGTAMVVTFN